MITDPPNHACRACSNTTRTGIAIFTLTLLFTVPFLGQLEFFRHTEADRTLIGWEMFRSGDWLVPHLLGDLYLTKPPLYYQFLAAVFSIFGEPSEFAARLSSALAFAALIAAHYLFSVKAQLTKQTALLSAALLGASAQLFTASIESEIDLTLVFFTTVSSWFAYFIVTTTARRSQLLNAALLGFFAALGFLTKGPPGLFFPFIGAGVFYILYDRRWASFLALSLAALTSLTIIAAWIWLLAREVSLEILWHHFNFEVLARVQSDPLADERARPAFFYLGTVLGGALPASLFLLFPAFWRQKPPAAEITRFCAGLIIPSLIVFSCASGKSSRYLLPVLPFVITWIVANTTLSKEAATRILVTVLTVFLIARLGYAFAYAPQRNAKLSVRPIANRIMTAGYHDLFILEMFERWLPYYLLRGGVSVKRLTPALAAHLNDSDEYDVLLSRRSEEWRLQQLLEDQRTKLETFPYIKADFVVAKVRGSTLKKLKLSELFPTVSTAP